jgi:hypothetical protein
MTAQAAIELEALSKRYGPTHLAVEQAGLDEAFLAFYRQAEAEAGTAGGRSA